MVGAAGGAKRGVRLSPPGLDVASDLSILVGMLKPLLARAREYHPEYRGGLCNHLPMALIALDRLGASPARLQRYATAYLKNMEPAPAPGAGIDETDWQEWLGEADAYADYLGF